MCNPYVRVLDLLTYKVIESMVKDGLISGLPYSEVAQWEEFTKRMREAQQKEGIIHSELEAWLPINPEPFFGTNRYVQITRTIPKVSIWNRIKAAYSVFMEK